MTLLTDIMSTYFASEVKNKHDNTIYRRQNIREVT